jgi:hypothetical protein
VTCEDVTADRVIVMSWPIDPGRIVSGWRADRAVVTGGVADLVAIVPLWVGVPLSDSLVVMVEDPAGLYGWCYDLTGGAGGLADDLAARLRAPGPYPRPSGAQLTDQDRAGRYQPGTEPEGCWIPGPGSSCA